MPDKYYCKLDKHPSPESVRLSGDEKIWRSLLDCPHICCVFCSRLHSCGFVCWRANTAEKGTEEETCPDQCTIQEKVFGKILEKLEDEDLFI